MGFSVGIDTGGTFSDIVVMDGGGEILNWKVPTASGYREAVIEGLSGVAGKLGLTVRELLQNTERFIYSTTVATNSIIQRENDGRTGCIVSKGFRDTLFIRRGIRKTIWDCQEPYFPPFVRRAHVREVNERVDAGGRVIVPLDLEEVRRVVSELLSERRLVSGEIEAVAVCFIHSYACPGHERAVAKLIREEFPHIFVSASVDVAPEIREYERMSTAVFNAYIGKKASIHFKLMEEGLRSRGLSSTFHIMQSNGGVAGLDEVSVRPVNTVFSGPAGGVMAAAYIGSLIGQPDILTMDMGGTSFDVGMVRESEPVTSRMSELAAYPLMGERIEIHSIGAGGGTIAWVDGQGVLRVGPRSAGAVPGPACYGRGGDEPTVTDADVLLGYINPDYFLGGQIKLDRSKALQAIREKIAGPMGIGPVEAAAGIVRVVEANMIDAVRLLTVQRGMDPRDLVLMAFGGAGPTHAASIMKELGASRLVVPVNAAVFSSFGLLATDLRHSYSHTYRSLLDGIDLARANSVLAEMAQKARKTLEQEGVPDNKIRIEASVDMSYIGQLHELNVPLGTTVLTPEALADLKNAYAEKYRAKYGFSEELPLQTVTFRVVGVGMVTPPVLAKKKKAGHDPAAASKGYRDVYFEECKGFRPTPVYDGALIRPGNLVDGPAVVEYPGTTLVVLPGQKAVWDEYGNAVIS